jgi:hypothetical protein
MSQPGEMGGFAERYSKWDKYSARDGDLDMELIDEKVEVDDANNAEYMLGSVRGDHLLGRVSQESTEITKCIQQMCEAAKLPAHSDKLWAKSFTRCPPCLDEMTLYSRRCELDRRRGLLFGALLELSLLNNETMSLKDALYLGFPSMFSVNDEEEISLMDVASDRIAHELKHFGYEKVAPKGSEARDFFSFEGDESAALVENNSGGSTAQPRPNPELELEPELELGANLDLDLKTKLNLSTNNVD